jgi:predicted Zn-dependent protease
MIGRLLPISFDPATDHIRIWVSALNSRQGSLLSLSGPFANAITFLSKTNGPARINLSLSGFFYNLGRKLGREAVPAIRKSKWIWDGLTGTEEEALRAEIAAGGTLATELHSISTPVSDPAIVTSIEEVCRELSACVRSKGRSFRCEVIHDGSPNAIALPGGFLFLSDSLVELCERQPDELAFVIGHEMGHVIRGHAWNRMLNEAALRVASTVTARAGPLGAWVRQQGIVLLRTAHSRDAETEADEFGVRLAAAARYRAEGAITLLHRIERHSQQAVQLGHYFASHPPAAERIARLQPLVRQLGASQANPAT